MAYIGKQPVVGNFVKLDTITTSATATYNLLNGGVAYFPQTANNCIVSLNGVIQSPTSAYTISGSTIVFSDALTSSDTIDFILVLGDVLSIGTPSDGTITSAKLASGTDGLFAWQSVQTTGFTAVAARAYPCNTTSAGFTVTLPASPSVGDQVLLLDYAGTADTNAITINPNGNKIEGGTANVSLTGEREGVTLTYIDSTQGWLASSGINEGTDALVETFTADFLVIAGGGGGGLTGSGGLSYGAGGGGAGGYRTSAGTSGGGASAESQLTLGKGVSYTVTVGAGGASDISGSNSVFSSITSIGGGACDGNGAGTGLTGGSGGGGISGATGGSGTANQGYAGGNGASSLGSGGSGGGAGGTGNNGTNGVVGSTTGGLGVASSITGSSVTRAVGGAGGPSNVDTNGTAGGANTGTGGGGSGITGGGSQTGGAGGSGIVIVKYPDTITISNPGGGLTSSTSSSGGFKVTSFTAGTGTIQFN